MIFLTCGRSFGSRPVIAFEPGTGAGWHPIEIRTTKKNLTVVAIDQERNLLLVKGSVPGSKNGIVFIRPSR